MGILDVFKVNDYKEQIAKLTAENQQLQDKANVNCSTDGASKASGANQC